MGVLLAGSLKMAVKRRTNEQTSRGYHTAAFKAKVALTAVKLEVHQVRKGLPNVNWLASAVALKKISLPACFQEIESKLG